MDCPYCEGTFSSRGISNHMRAKHPERYPSWRATRAREMKIRKEKERAKKRREREARARILTEWEREFLFSIENQLREGNELSEKQEDVLSRILEKRDVPVQTRENLTLAREAQQQALLTQMQENRDINLDNHIAVIPKWGKGNIDGTTQEADILYAGPVLIPDGWVFTPKGNSARTRAIKRHARWWVVLGKVYFYNRSAWKPAGLLCPEPVQDAVAEYLVKTADKRRKAREYRRKRRAKLLREQGIT